jgi:hypothetical protein
MPANATRPDRRFDPATLAGLDEPVRRYLAHALRPGAAIPDGVRLTMTGRIRVGRWLSFTAEQELRGDAFTWWARAGRGPVRPLRVVDRYADGRGSTDGRLFGVLRFLHAADGDTARSAAGRAAAESIFAPFLLLPGARVAWRAERPERIVARVSVPPETADVGLGIDAAGAVRSVDVLRWGDAGSGRFGYVRFGGEVGGERRFGDLVLPGRVRVGWWYGTPRYAPFFEATILSAEPLPQR